MKLMVIFGSSRQGRKGEVVANWVKNSAIADKRFEIDFVDLRELDLPFFDEPISPFSMKSAGLDYTNPKGKIWAERVEKANAVILVTPEYNHAPPAVLKNALDWVGPEWIDKPVGMISYGGISGGIRAVEQLRTITIELGLFDVANALHFPHFKHAFNEDGEPVDEAYGSKLTKMLDEIERIHNAFQK
jgi:NAD(P)H-dependent FMN reductase